MKAKNLKSLIILLSGLLLACSAAKKETAQREDQAQAKSLKEIYDRGQGNYTKRILAGKCRISGTIKAIDPKLYSDDPDNPCSKAPCRATVVVDEILGYGAGFSRKLAAGEELQVFFKFSLSPSREANPQLQLILPGLKEGSQFIADLESTPVIGAQEEELTIYRYEIK